MSDFPLNWPEVVAPFWNIPAGIDLDLRIVREVLGQTVIPNPANYRGYEVYWDVRYGHKSDVFFFSTQMGVAWQIVDVMSRRMGYGHPGYLWRGPSFKPEHFYMTQEGYPLGTTCWYVNVETKDFDIDFCADTPALAICRAALFAVSQGIT